VLPPIAESMNGRLYRHNAQRARLAALIGRVGVPREWNCYGRPFLVKLSDSQEKRA
jgi:hypothetical protein